MATLAEQLESALEGTQSAMSASDIGEILSGTATSIQPGTITPITSQQSNQLSWNNVFKKISEGIELQPGEGLPEVPKNIPASTFYRTATQAGALPAGGSQFFTQPLAPETPAMETGVTETAATEPETTVTSGTQNVARQVQESFDLHEGSDTDVDFHVDPFAQHMEQTRIEQTLALGLNPDAIGIERVKNDMALLGSAVGKRLEDPKTLFGLALPMELSIPLTILQSVFSEGHGQIGLTGLVSDDYWGEDGSTVETPTQVYGFAMEPGSTFSIAVDKYGREVVTNNGVTKGGWILGWGSTVAGQNAYNARRDRRPPPFTIAIDPLEYTNPAFAEADPTGASPSVTQVQQSPYGQAYGDPDDEEPTSEPTSSYTGQYAGVYGSTNPYAMSADAPVEVDGGDQGTGDTAGPGGDESSGPGSGFGY